MNTNELKTELGQFYGTQYYYRYPLNPSISYTDGVKYFADEVGAYWLFDIVATQPEILKTMKDGFAVVDLIVQQDNKAVLLCTDGNKNSTYSRDIDYTDCPAGEWRFFFTNDVILLPGEY